MLNLLGEYDCKVDSKGRLMFPAKLRKQLEPVLSHGLVINRDIFAKCLVLYPKPEWDKVNEEMNRLSRYNRSHQQFQRRFMNGATAIELDSAGRMLIPASLLEYAGIDPKNTKEVKVNGIGQKIEMWSKPAFEAEILNQGDDFGDLAEDVRKDLDDSSQSKLN
ncbi:MAG TPA: division/cell wall cluster transcriptional repressor MraZ [Flavobacteriales bacterium]|nr:division/cell wall cluster transcriptional repressor MraZ [Flavobacteriales bacterium]